MDNRPPSGHNKANFTTSLSWRTLAMSIATTRRDFLVASAVTGGALAAEALIANAHAQQNIEVIRVGLIGCGGRGSGAAEQCLRADDNVRLVAVADNFRDCANSCLTRLRNNAARRGQ